MNNATNQRQNGIVEAVMAAKKDIRLTKIHSPHVLPQFAELEAARKDVEVAKARLDRAQRIWDKLGY